jgi:AraC-like DNA-binding protein
VSIQRLSDEAGVSRQHFTRVFRDAVGLTPKLYCRLARFHAGLGYAGCGLAVDGADLAQCLGYADQVAHDRGVQAVQQPDAAAAGFAALVSPVHRTCEGAAETPLSEHVDLNGFSDSKLFMQLQLAASRPATDG